MIQLTHQSRILLGTAPADFRRGIDGFVALCQNTLSLNPREQSVFVFINKARTMIRALSYDGTGYWLLTKRISRGKFHGWPTANAPVSEATALQLRRILGGSGWIGIRQPHQLSLQVRRRALRLSANRRSLVPLVNEPVFLFL